MGCSGGQAPPGRLHNFGDLPGGGDKVSTRPGSPLLALKAALDLLMSGGIVNDYSTRDMGWAVAPARLVIEPRRASLSPVGQSQ